MPVQPSDDDEQRELDREHRRREADLNARVTRWQRAIKVGDYFRRSSEHGYYIYGKILPDKEPPARGWRNYRFCRSYSIECVTGEIGYVHVSIIERLLTAREFSAARARRWDS